MLEMGITFDFGQLVMDNDFAGMIKHAVRGIQVNDSTLSVDIINEVGPFGEFISHEHTYQHFRGEQSQYKLFDKQTRNNWEAQGGKDLVMKAYEEAKMIMESHQPMALPAGAAEKVQDIVKEAEAHYGVAS